MILEVRVQRARPRKPGVGPYNDAYVTDVREGIFGKGTIYFMLRSSRPLVGAHEAERVLVRSSEDFNGLHCTPRIVR